MWLAFLREHGITDTYNNIERGIYTCVTNIRDTRIKNVFHSEKVHVHLPVLRHQDSLCIPLHYVT